MWRHCNALMVVVLMFSSAAVLKAQQTPFTGVVVQDDAVVRAGAGQPFYAVGRLKAGDRVTVREVMYGWQRIDAPKGVYSYISKMHVDARGDGAAGVVNTDHAPVTAASADASGPSYQTQIELKKGDTVRIVDDKGSFYKIEPPAGATVFMAPGAVRPATQADLIAFEKNDGQPAKPKPQPKPDTQPKPEPKPQPQPGLLALEGAGDTVVEREETVVVDAAGDAAVSETETVVEAEPEPAKGDAPPAQPDAKTSQPAAASGAGAELPGADLPGAGEMVKGDDVPAVAESANLAQVEAKMLPLFMKPVEQQPIAEMIAAYTAVQNQPNLSAADKQIVQMRLMALDRNHQLAEALKEIAIARKQAQAAEDEAVQAGEQIAAETEAAVEPTHYNLTGLLTSSNFYNGESQPLMFRLVEPSTGRTIGYIHPGSVKKPKQMLGQTVGVIGEVAYDPGLQIPLVHVERIDVVE